MSPKLVVMLGITCWVCSEELQDCLDPLSRSIELRYLIGGEVRKVHNAA